MQGIVEANLAERERAATEIETMIETELVDFENWLATLGVVPVISALRKKANAIQQQTMVSIENKMPELTERERKILNKHTKSIINQLLKDPILQVKEIANEKKASEQLRLFQQIFNLEEAVEEEKQAMEQVEKDRLAQMKQQTTPTLGLSF